MGLYGWPEGHLNLFLLCLVWKEGYCLPPFSDYHLNAAFNKFLMLLLGLERSLTKALRIYFVVHFFVEFTYRAVISAHDKIHCSAS